MDLVSVFPTALTLNEFDFLGPSRAVTGGVEEEEWSADEGFDALVVWVRDGEGDVSERGFWGGLTASISPVWSFHKNGRFQKRM